MIYPVKVFDKDGNLKRIIPKDELEEEFWNPTKIKSKGNRNSHLFSSKDKHSSDKLDLKLSHGTFHPKIP
jgi:hypothetical protein